MCETCSPDAPICSPVQSYPSFSVREYGMVVGESDMMKEIAARGPIACAMCVTPEFLAFKAPGQIFKDNSGCVKVGGPGALHLADITDRS